MTTTDHAAFMLAIAADLADDTPRRVYADFLEENGEPERSEFIRVQCDIAKYEAELSKPYEDQDLCESVCARWCPVCGDCCCREPEDGMNDSDCPLHAPTSRHHSDDSLKSVVASLHAREVELFAEHGRDWFREVFELLPDFNLDWVKRGWPAAVTLDLGTLCGERCRRCRSAGWDGAPDCPDCKGEGDVPGIAAALHAACPALREVRVVDREAALIGGFITYAFLWLTERHIASADFPAAVLPEEIYRQPEISGMNGIHRRSHGFASPALAADALNGACLKLIREGKRK